MGMGGKSVVGADGRLGMAVFFTELLTSVRGGFWPMRRKGI